MVTAQTYDLAFNRDQPRGPDGRWINTHAGTRAAVTKTFLKGGVLKDNRVSPPKVQLATKKKSQAETFKFISPAEVKVIEDEFSDHEALWKEISAERAKAAGKEEQTWRWSDDQLKNAIVSPTAPETTKAAALAEIRARREFVAQQTVNATKVMAEGKETGKWRTAIRKYMPKPIADRLLRAERKLRKEHPHLHRTLDRALDGMWDAIMHVGLSAIAAATILAQSGEHAAAATGAVGH